MTWGIKQPKISPKLSIVWFYLYLMKKNSYQYSTQHRDAPSQHIPQINKQEHLELHPKVFIMSEKMVPSETIVTKLLQQKFFSQRSRC